MKVLWQLSATDSATIAWGPDTTYSSGSVVTHEYGTGHQHAYVISGLAPGSKVLYKVTVGATSFRGSFRSPPPADATDLRFMAYGDTRTNPSVHDSVAGAMDGVFAADSSYQTLVLMAGDCVTDGTMESNWTSEFFNSAYTNIRALMANLPYQACMGTHEGDGILFTKYFPYPFAGARYWSFDYGPAHFTVVDQYSNYSSGSPQLQWIANDLAGSTKQWKFLLLHEPGWSAGGGHENNASVQTLLQPLCLQYGVSIVFGGHNHYYARAVVNGVEHITTGGGGAPLYPPIPSSPYVVAAAAANHYCTIEITSGSLVFRAIKRDGTLLDTFTLQAPPVAVGTPTAPRLEPANPNPFSDATTIRWQAAAAAGTRLLILDVSGRLVRTFPSVGLGPQSARWNGRDDRGRPVNSGMYFYRLDVPSGGARAGRLLLIR
jgi:hypothetical protein